MSSW
jgi:hypothetical protein